jgi:hypothetical protein
MCMLGGTVALLGLPSLTLKDKPDEDPSAVPGSSADVAQAA